MRHTGYWSQYVSIQGSEPERHGFTTENYRDAQALFTPLIGLHESGALALVNKWNRESKNRKYWLEVAK